MHSELATRRICDKRPLHKNTRRALSDPERPNRKGPKVPRMCAPRVDATNLYYEYEVGVRCGDNQSQREGPIEKTAVPTSHLGNAAVISGKQSALGSRR